MNEIEILCEELEEITLEDTREVVTVEKPVYPELEDLIVKPTTEEQKFKSSEYGYNNVTVEAIQDENLIAENIKSGTEILGVKGNFTGGKYKPRYLYNPISFKYYTGTELDQETSMLDTTHFTNMNQMFYYCQKLISLNLSDWNTSNVTNMSGMFDSCQELTSLNLTGWNTSNVINMKQMFNRCKNLTMLNLSDFDTSNVTTFFYLFSECEKLTELNVGNWNTSNVTDMYGIFNYCRKLTTLDLKNWDTSNVTNMTNMFFGCSVLNYVDMRNFTFDKVTSYSNMFGSSMGNALIVVKDNNAKNWITSKFTYLKNVKTVAELEG